MDWRFFIKLFLGMFYNSKNFINSIPTYLGIISYFLFLFPKYGWFMKDRLLIARTYAIPILMGFVLFSIILTSHSLYKNKRPIFATPDELTQSVLRDRDIRLSDLTREDFRIRNKSFFNCHIYGPAIIYPHKDTVLIDLVFKGVTPEGGLIVTTNKQVSGAVSFERCVLKNCTLHRISFIGSEARIAKIKAGSNLQ